MRRGAAGAAVRYGRVLRHGHASRPFAAAVVARLPVAMAPLGMLLLVRQEQGSYAYAGLVTGAFAIGNAIGSPWWGARIDRLGQARVMLGTSLTSAALIACLTVAAVRGAGPLLLLVPAVLAGATFPPLTPGMRATWIAVLDDPAERQVAFALDAAAVESIFIGGPLLLSLLTTLTAPVVPLLVTAVLLGVAGTVYSRTSAVRGQGPRVVPDQDVPPGPSGRSQRSRRSGQSALRTGGVPAVLIVTTAVSVGFGQADTALAATARQILGDPSRVGVLFTAIAGGSVVGGLVYGGVRTSVLEHRRLPLTLLGFGFGLSLVGLLLTLPRVSLWWLLPLLFLAGLSIAPSLIITQNLVGRLAAHHQVSEAQSWLSTAGTAGSAAGTAVAGILVDRLGVSWAFAGAGLAVLLGSAVGFARRRGWTVAVADGPRAQASLG